MGRECWACNRSGLLPGRVWELLMFCIWRFMEMRLLLFYMGGGSNLIYWIDDVALVIEDVLGGREEG